MLEIGLLITFGMPLFGADPTGGPPSAGGPISSTKNWEMDASKSCTAYFNSIAYSKNEQVLYCWQGLAHVQYDERLCYRQNVK